MAVQAIAPVGASITFLALITGAIWGKPTGNLVDLGCAINFNTGIVFLYIGMMALRPQWLDRVMQAELVPFWQLSV